MRFPKCLPFNDVLRILEIWSCSLCKNEFKMCLIDSRITSIVLQLVEDEYFRLGIVLVW